MSGFEQVGGVMIPPLHKAWKIVSNAFQRNYLVIEVHRSFDYIKPFRSNLINRESFNEYGEGGDDLGFSEVHLNHGLKYHLLSCQMIKANLIKVILSYQRITNQLENSYN